jgi:hypothetical protein
MLHEVPVEFVRSGNVFKYLLASLLVFLKSRVLYLVMIHAPQHVAYTEEANTNLLWLTVIHVIVM